MASKIVAAYGQVLSQISPGFCGAPASMLPYSRDQIETAYERLLPALGPEASMELKRSLVEGYAYLAQFVDDDSAALIGSQQTGVDEMQMAMRLVNDIKVEMERRVERAAELMSRS